MPTDTLPARRRAARRLLAALPLLSIAILSPAPALPAPAPAAGAGELMLRDTRVLRIQAGRGGLSPEERARAASRALLQAHEARPGEDAHVELRGDEAVLRIGPVPFLELGSEDVRAAGASGIEPLATSSAAAVDQALRAERRRASLAESVFNVSLVVLSGLVAFLLLRKLSELDRGVTDALRARRGAAPALRLRGVELVSPGGVAGGMAVGVRLGRYLLQVVVAYAWLVFALSLFPGTRSAGFRLGSGVLGPAAATLTRIGAAVPLTVAALVAGAILVLLVRFVHLFFGSVSRGETHLSWLAADVARPLGQVVSIALVILAAVFAAPILTGDREGVLASVGQAALLAAALAAAPVLAGVAAGLPRVFGRTYRPGHVAQIGSTTGVVRSVGLLDVELEDPSGRRVLVPHLTALVAPTRLPGLAAAARFELAVDPSNDQALVREILLRTGGPGTAADLLHLDGTAAVYRVTGPGADLAIRIASALRAEGIRLADAPAGLAGDA
ncbi:MAG TPA: mechanosensitive ion channel domain-containing protein [Anaeromyxobacteraceae bacterium]|nr:mechanosensitive ion channel domain-containing protein [Anaeromyxobacteraceae bacterium]